MRVVAGEARTGKTTEFREQANSLNKLGEQIAFFVPIEDLANDSLKRALDSEDISRLNDWRKTDRDAIFFLDSVDEARLKSRSPFRIALRNFVRDLGNDGARAIILISCRVSDWQYKADLTIVKSEFRKLQRPPKSKHHSVDSANKTASRTYPPDEPVPIPIKVSPSTDKQDIDVRVVQIAPLTPEQVTLLAQAYGVHDVDGLATALDDADAWIFAERPGDVEWLSAYWQEKRHLGSLQDLIEHNVSGKLRDPNPSYINDGYSLSLENAREGAETLAAAAIFCERSGISIPDPEFNVEPASEALRPDMILQDWKAGKVRALLTRGIFDEATYGRVRFHHRSTTEYLCACWIKKLNDKGCPSGAIRQLFFKDLYGRTLFIPSRAAVLGWVGDFIPEVRHSVQQVAPEILLFFGDPELLSVKERQNALRGLVKRYEDKRRFQWIVQDSDLRRLADPAISETIKDLLSEYTSSQDIRELLLRIVRLGRLSSCSETTMAIAINPSESDSIRSCAIEAIGEAGTEEQLRKLARYAFGTKALPNEIIASLCEVLFPSFIDVEGCLDLVRESEREAWNASPHVATTMEYKIVEHCPASGLPALLEGLIGLTENPPKGKRGGGKLSPEHFWWVPNSIVKIVIRILRECNTEALPTERLIVAFSFLQDCNANRSPHIHDLDKLKEELRIHPEIRRAIFWSNFEEELRKGRGARFYIHTLDSICPLSAEDLSWLLVDAVDSETFNKTKAAFDAAVVIWSIAGRPKDRAKDIVSALEQCVKKGKARMDELSEEVEGTLFPPPPVESEWQRRFRERQEDEERTRKAQLDESRKNLKGNLDEIRSGENLNALYFLYNQIASSEEGNHSSWAQSNWKAIISDFGEEIGEAAREGWKKRWVRWKPPLPHEREDPNRVDHGVPIGLTGLQIAADDGLDFSTLTDEEAGTAAHYALSELNGFPDWFPRLVESHPETVCNVIRKQIIAEFKIASNVSSPHGTLTNIKYMTGETQEICATIILDLLKKRDPEHPKLLNDALSIALRAQPTNHARVARFAAKRVPDYEKSNRTNHLVPWLVAWIYTDTEAAWNFVGELISKEGIIPNPFVQRLASALAEPFGLEGEIGNLDFLKPGILRRMIPVFQTHIRQDDDIWHEDTYSPGERDRAESFRNRLPNLLMGIKGVETYNALMNLANDERIADLRGTFLRLADQQAADSVEEEPWIAGHIVEFERTYEKDPQMPSELYHICLNRLADIKNDIESGDFSERGLFQQGMPEGAIQKWLASKLRDRNKNRYTVHHEEEVDLRKKPDVRLWNPRAGTVGIEVKPLDNRYTYNQLVFALKEQLVGKYLRAVDSRHGILFLAKLKNRRWDPRDRTGRIDFSELLERLNEIADNIVTRNEDVDSLCVIGVDFTVPTT